MFDKWAGEYGKNICESDSRTCGERPGEGSFLFTGEAKLTSWEALGREKMGREVGLVEGGVSIVLRVRPGGEGVDTIVEPIRHTGRVASPHACGKLDDICKCEYII